MSADTARAAACRTSLKAMRTVGLVEGHARINGRLEKVQPITDIAQEVEGMFSDGIPEPDALYSALDRLAEATDSYVAQEIGT